MSERPTGGGKASRRKPRMAEVAVAVERDPWEKQPGETQVAWTAFVLYRDLGFGRSVRRAAEIHSESTGRNVDTVARGFFDFSAKWRWQQRCEAYDLAVDRRMRESREAEWEKRQAQHASLFQSLQLRAALRVVGGELPDGTKIAAAPIEELSLMDAARVLDLAVKGERVANGKPADLLRGALTMTGDEVRALVTKVVETLWPYVRDDARDQAVVALESLWKGRL